MDCCGVAYGPEYLECVHALENILICNPPHERPLRSAPLAPFDQASQKQVFGAASDRGTPEQFLEWAKRRKHPSEDPPPLLEHDLECAVSYVWQQGLRVSADRERRLHLLRSVASRLERLTHVLASHMSSSAISVARAMMLNIIRRVRPMARLEDVGDRLYAPHFGLWCAMLDALRWPQRNLVALMLRGFKAVGDVPDSRVWRAVERPASMPFEQFASSNTRWVVQCKRRVLAMASSNAERAMVCWLKTIEERDSGLCQGPFTIEEMNKAPSPDSPESLGFGRYRPLPQFALWNGKKWRCISDAAASGTNKDGTSMHETNVCDRPDSPLRIGLRFHHLGPPPMAPWVRVEMGAGTDDKFAAYKVVVTADEGYMIVMVAAPAGMLYANSPSKAVLFKVPGNCFGLVSAVTNWHALSEPPVVFSRRFFGTPITRFYDDHQISEPSYAGGSGQHAHFELHELLRFHFDVGKHVSWHPSPLYTGVVTDWSRDSEGIVTIGVSEDRREGVRSMIRNVLGEQTLSKAEASSLRGKSRWTLCPVFGRVGMAVVALLKARQDAPDGDDSDVLTDELADALRLLYSLMDLLPNHTIRFRRERVCPACIVLTDASFATGHMWLGFLVCCPIRGGLWAGIETPAWLMKLLRQHKERDTYIGQLEAAVAPAPFFSLPQEWFRDRPVMHYIDNQGALYSLINGRSRDVDINRLVFVTRMRLLRLNCDAWFDYVPSASNFADLPTRLDRAAFARLDRVARRVELRLPPQWCLSCPEADLTSLLSF